MSGTKKNWLFLLASLGLLSGIALGLAYHWTFHGEGILAGPETRPLEPGPSAAGQVDEQSLAFLTPTVNLGNQRKKAEHAFELENRGAAPVTINRVSTSCSCTATHPDRKSLDPGDKCMVRITVDLRHQPRG